MSGRDPDVYTAVPLHTDIPATVCYRTNEIVTTPSARLAVDYLLAPYATPARPKPWARHTPSRSATASSSSPSSASSSPGPVAEPVVPALRSVDHRRDRLAMWAALRMHLERRAPTRVSGPPATGPSPSPQRQQRIIALVREGRTSAQIAGEIGFSVPTVKSELARLSALLGAATRADLACESRTRRILSNTLPI